MKISLFSLPEINPGKHNIKDERLDQIDKITKSKKKTYIQVEIGAEDGALEADVIAALKDNRTDLVLKDLEFVESRLTRATDDAEKNLLNKFKVALEKEELISSIALNEEEKKMAAIYGLLTIKPVVLVEKSEMAEPDKFLFKVFQASDFISFFTTGEKETRAWLIKKGTTAWEAAGVIHSDIQQGFIRAEIISFKDFIESGSETAAKQAGKLRLEQKGYSMQDCDLANFRFNK
ncbi:MAG: DUF933 domain-containing protein [Candidatus Omnitrophica bacterium]|nr:DUF933 domain-containing protein [Candidatus Omnitrophota bacterium]